MLINNAGVYCAKRGETADGFENTMGINYLGPFLLTHLLLPVLKNTPGARIINVSSNAYFQGKLDLNNFHFKKGYQGFKAYSTSKLAVVLFTLDLAERLKGTGITVNAVHPGHVKRSSASKRTSPIEQAIAFRDALRAAAVQANELIRSLKQQKREARLVQTTLASLRQLQKVGA